MDFSDRLAFFLREDGVSSCIPPLPAYLKKQDLCVRAAKLLQQESGISRGVEIFLEKRIPMGGGLGGGSSDAATTLLALNRLWDVGWKRDRLLKLGLNWARMCPCLFSVKMLLLKG